MQSLFNLDGGDITLWLSRADGGYCLHVDGVADGQLASLRPAPGGEPHCARYMVSLDGDEAPVVVAQARDELFIHLNGRAYTVRYVDPLEQHARDAAASTEDDIRAPMPGTVVSVAVEPGQLVTAGDTLVIIESMKMETRCLAGRNGTVGSVLVAPGMSFERDQVLVRLEATA